MDKDRPILGLNADAPGSWIETPCCPIRVEIFDMWWISLVPAISAGIGMKWYDIPVCVTCKRPVEAVMLHEVRPCMMVQFHCHEEVEYTVKRNGRWERLDGNPRRSDLPGQPRMRL